MCARNGARRWRPWTGQEQAHGHDLPLHRADAQMHLAISERQEQAVNETGVQHGVGLVRAPVEGIPGIGVNAQPITFLDAMNFPGVHGAVPGN